MAQDLLGGGSKAKAKKTKPNPTQAANQVAAANTVTPVTVLPTQKTAAVKPPMQKNMPAGVSTAPTPARYTGPGGQSATNTAMEYYVGYPGYGGAGGQNVTNTAMELYVGNQKTPTPVNTYTPPPPPPPPGYTDTGGGGGDGGGGGGGGGNLPPTGWEGGPKIEPPGLSGIQVEPGAMIGPPGFEAAPPEPPYIQPGQQYGDFLEISPAEEDLGYLPPDVRKALDEWLTSMGYGQTGNVGRFGERTYSRPKGNMYSAAPGAIAFSERDFARLSDPSTRNWIRWFMGELGYAPRVGFPGTLPADNQGGTYNQTYNINDWLNGGQPWGETGIGPIPGGGPVGVPQPVPSPVIGPPGWTGTPTPTPTPMIGPPGRSGPPVMGTPQPIIPPGGGVWVPPGYGTQPAPTPIVGGGGPGGGTPIQPPPGGYGLPGPGTGYPIGPQPLPQPGLGFQLGGNPMQPPGPGYVWDPYLGWVPANMVTPQPAPAPGLGWP